MDNTVPFKMNWDRLCRNIDEKNVIPVIGNEMYKYMQDGKLNDIESYFSSKLFSKYDAGEIRGKSITEAIDYLVNDQQIDIRDINDDLQEITKSALEFPLLNHLLSIDQILFYVNITVYGNLLVDRITKLRSKKPIEGNFSINETFGDYGNVEDLKQPFIFNIFGSLADNVGPALKVEEMLEFTTALITKMSDQRFTSILDALKNKTLLFLGCSHPESLMRLIFRILSNERIDNWQRRRSDMIFVNDAGEFRDQQFSFLKNYKVITYPGNTDEFILELSTKWKEWIKVHPPEPKRIFISYSHKDKAAADKLFSILSEINHVQCWYDNSDLHAGDNFTNEIVINIDKADIFIPLLSNNSLSGENTYVKREWLTAFNANVNRKIRFPEKINKYLLPIVIDDANLGNPIIAEYFPSLSIASLPGGQADETFIQVIKKELEIV